MKPPSPGRVSRKRLAQRGARAAACAVAHHDDLRHLELRHGEFERGRDAVIAAGQVQRRHQIRDVADDEDLAGRSVEDLGGIDAAVRTGDHHHLGLLPFGQLRPARALASTSRHCGSGGSRAIISLKSVMCSCLAVLCEGLARVRAKSLSGEDEQSSHQSSPRTARAQARLDPREGARRHRLRRDQGADAPAQPRHGVRGSGLPEHRRVLDQEARDGDDPRRYLHPRLRLLQRQDGDAEGGRPQGTAACRRCGGRTRPRTYRRHLGRSRRSARWRRQPVRQGDRGAAPHDADARRSRS